MEEYGDNIDPPLWCGLYKEEEYYLVPCSGTDPDEQMNCFNWSKDNNYWIFPEDQYDEEFKNWREPIQNGQFRSQTLKEKRKTEETCSKYAGSDKFNVIPREVKLVITINSYKGQCREHMISNEMWGIFSLPYPHNKEIKWDLLLHQSIFPLEYVKRHV